MKPFKISDYKEAKILMTFSSVVQLSSTLFRAHCEKEVEVEYQGKGKKY